jgi:hypothetical protein
MIRRILSFFRRQPRTETLPAPSADPQNDAYLIGITITVEVRGEPPETFTERAQAALIKALRISAARVLRSMFYPTKDGRVEMYEGDDKSPKQ